MPQLSENPALPTPYGIFRNIPGPVYEVEVNAQTEQAVSKKGPGKLEDLVWSGETWTIG